MASDRTESRSWIAEAGVLGVLAAGAAYALGYSAQYGYYNAFGLTPEQAGVDRMSALLRITPLAALFGVATTFGVAGALVLGRRLQREVLDYLPFRWIRFPAFIVIPTLALIPLLFMGTNAREMYRSADGTPTGKYWVWEVLLAAVFIWLVVASVWWVFERALGTLAATTGTGVAVVASACLFLTFDFAHTPALVLRDHPSAASSIRLELIGLPRSYAEVQWKDQAEAPRYFQEHPGRIFLVLGENSGRYLLYDYCEQKIHPVENADAHVARVLPPIGESGSTKDAYAWVGRAFPC